MSYIRGSVDMRVMRGSTDMRASSDSRASTDLRGSLRRQSGVPVGKLNMPEWQLKVLEVLNNTVYQVIMGLILLLSVFFADAWILGNAPNSQDDAKDGLLTVIFVLFCIEVMVLSVVEKGYIMGFFFWMDILGTISLLIDIDWISRDVLPKNAVRAQGAALRTTRIARIGARFSRLLRLIRVLRRTPLTRFIPQFILNLMTPQQSEHGYQKVDQTLSTVRRVTADLSTILSVRVAMIVLIMVIAIPFLIFTPIDHGASAWASSFAFVARNPNTTQSDINSMAITCLNFYSEKRVKLRSLRVDTPWLNNSNLESPTVFKEKYKTRDVLRSENVLKYTDYYEFTENPTYGNGRYKVAIRVDVTERSQQAAAFNIAIVILVIFILFAFTASFNNVVDTIVVKPLSKTLSTLKQSAVQMMRTLDTISKNEKKTEDSADEGDGRGSLTSMLRDSNTNYYDVDDDAIETLQLELVVQKLSRIVQVVLSPKDESALYIGEGMDRPTATWLKKSYSSSYSGSSGSTNPRSPSRVSSNQNKRQSRRPQSMFFGSESTPGENSSGSDRYRRFSIDNSSNASQSIEEECSSLTIEPEELDSWDFDVLEFSTAALNEVMYMLFSQFDLFTIFGVMDDCFFRFLHAISTRYLNNPYHNYKHGCCVCHVVYLTILIPQLDLIFTALEVFALLVAALAHDVGHLGLNNVYLIKAKHTLALQHNDKSPLENMHCVVLYDVLKDKDTNIFMNLKEDDWREVRKIMLTTILGTDMANHFEQVRKAQLFQELHGDGTRLFCTDDSVTVIDSLAEDGNRLLIMELLLHCADISNQLKPFHMENKWSTLVIEEFCLQGDREKSENLPISPMCDRTQINICNMQLGFIEFVVAPLINTFIQIFPPLHEAGSNLRSNFKQWAEQRKLEIENDTKLSSTEQSDEIKKIDERVKKFQEKMSYVDEYSQMKLRTMKQLSTRKSSFLVDQKFRASDAREELLRRHESDVSNLGELDTVYQEPSDTKLTSSQLSLRNISIRERTPEEKSV